MNFLRGMAAILAKDLHTEYRTRYAFNTVLAFVGASLLLILFAMKAGQLPPTPKSAIVWIIILFAALSSLSHSFVVESDRKTFDLLRLHSSPTEVFVGKLCFNYLFTLVINLLTFLIYLFLLGMPIADIFSFFIVLVLGTAGLSGVATMLAAIVSQADRRGAIFSVLSIPLLFPLILILVSTTKLALIEGTAANNPGDFVALFGYAGVTITSGILLFEYIWDE